MEIVPATAHHCRGIAEVHVETWQAAYDGLIPASFLASLSVARREEGWRRVIGQGRPAVLVARVADEVVGFVSFGSCRDDDAPTGRAEVEAIYVRPSHWSSGAGRKLWLAAMERLLAEGYESVSLWVIADNARAIRFYERAGFVLEPGAGRQIQIGGASIDEVRYVRQLREA